jgi:hypothetical protein
MDPRQPAPIPDHEWDAPSTLAALYDRDAGALIRLARKYGASQHYLASRAMYVTNESLTQNQISLIASGKARVEKLEVWERIAAALDMPDRARVRLGLAPREYSVPTGNGLSDQSSERTPTDVNESVRPGLGERSAMRTRALLAATTQHRVGSLRYMPPVDVSATIEDFIASPTRVYVIKGPPGSGKTRLTYHLAEQVSVVDFQLHTADSWSGHSTDLASEILRYASIEGGHDPLLTIERECAQLSHPIVVVIDGPSTVAEIQQVCHQLDTVLRQVVTKNLRFCLVLRTPPDVEFSAHPVLAAAITRPADGSEGRR